MRRRLRWLVLPLGALALGSNPLPTYDLSGVWDYTISEIGEVGPCPTTGDFGGEAHILQTAETFSLDFVSGQPCLPEGVCHLVGTVSGSHYQASNAVDVPGGGVAATTLDFVAASATAAAGSAVSTFTLAPDVCTWTYELTLTYAPEPEAAGLVALLALAAISARSTRRATRGSGGSWSPGSARR